MTVKIKCTVEYEQSLNSKTLASELLENLEEMSP